MTRIYMGTEFYHQKLIDVTCEYDEYSSATDEPSILLLQGCTRVGRLDDRGWVHPYDGCIRGCVRLGGTVQVPLLLWTIVYRVEPNVARYLPM